MQVVATTDCFIDNRYIKQGEHFEYTGPMDKTPEGKDTMPPGLARLELEAPPKEEKVKSLPAKGKSSKKKITVASKASPFDGL